jgi:hypothetical protein
VALAGTDDLPDQLLTQLYGEDPTDFVARRTAMVKELRGKGQPEVARKVAGLRRPPAGVWAANRLHEVASDDLEALIESGRRLREAQIAALEGKAISDFRSLLAAHSASLQRTVEAAVGFLVGQDQNVSETVRQRLQTTLRAVSLATPDLQAALAAGRLTTDLEPGGFSAFEGIQLPPDEGEARLAPTVPRPEEAVPRPQPAELDLAGQASAARTAADTQARVAREALQEARALRARARQLFGEAEAAASEAAAAEARAGAAADQADAMERDARHAEAAAARSARS